MRTELGDIPVTIISNDYGPDAPEPDRTNVQAQQGWLVLSPQARQVLVTTGHDIAFNEPELVRDEIRTVVRAAQEGS